MSCEHIDEDNECMKCRVDTYIDTCSKCYAMTWHTELDKSCLRCKAIAKV